MKRFVLLAAAAGLTLSAASAADFSVGSIAVDNPWTRATPRGAEVAGAYMTLTNKGSETDRLISGTFAAAGRFEVHSMEIEVGVARMRPVTGGLEIKPGQSVELKPGSFHVMLMGLREPLQAGQQVKGTLLFEKAGKVDIEYAVRPLGAAPPGH